MKKRSEHSPETPATRYLKEKGIPYSPHQYAYRAHGGTRASAEELRISEHSVVKTLVMEDEKASPLIILMHGDCKVSTKALARAAGCKQITPCRPETAQRHTGFLVGGTSPFGTRKPLPVFVERSVLDLPRIFINGGRRGFLVEIDPQVLLWTLDALSVECALSD